MRKMYQISLGILPIMMILLTGIAGADERLEFRAEVFADMIRENYQSALTNEERIGEYQLEKTIVDVHGQRVRIEEYLLRPEPSQIKFLTLNTRANRFDYGYHILTFGNEKGPVDVSSKSLEDLSQVIWMNFEEEPTYWLTDSDIKLSNTRDHVDMNMDIGKPIEITIAIPEFPSDSEVANESEDVSIDETLVPSSFYLPSFVVGKFSINGNPKEEFSMKISKDGKVEMVEKYITSDGMKTGMEYTYNLGSMDEPTFTEYPEVMPEWEFKPSPYGDYKAHYTELVNYKDGTWMKYEEYHIDDQGKIVDWNWDYLEVSEENGEVPDDKVIDAIQEYFAQQPNIQIIISASEFEGRTIDLVIAPMEDPGEVLKDMFMWYMW